MLKSLFIAVITSSFSMKINKKITVVLVLYLLIALITVGSNLLMTWRMDGEAAVINDAGRERMRSYRMALNLNDYIQHPAQDKRNSINRDIGKFELTLGELEKANNQKFIFSSEDALAKSKLDALHIQWLGTIRPQIEKILEETSQETQRSLFVTYHKQVDDYVKNINDYVTTVEQNNAKATKALIFFQIALIVIAVIGTIILELIFSRLFIKPIQEINNGLAKMGEDGFSIRLNETRKDELGQVIAGFNSMADRLQALYQTLEDRVKEKTKSLDNKNKELQTLYEIATDLNSATTTEPLCESVLDKIIKLIGAKGGVIRVADEKHERLKVVSAQGVSQSFLDEETYLDVGVCFCGEIAKEGISANADLTVPLNKPMLHSCSKEGFKSVVSIPIRSHSKQVGVLNLFFNDVVILPPGDLKLLEALGLHLGIAIENYRLISKEKELAIVEERNLLAQELHDNIAQSLAFLNIQTQLLDEDLANNNSESAVATLSQIREGIQESYDDVRELLVNFRTPLKHRSLDQAIKESLDKFESATGIMTEYIHHGNTSFANPEQILQVLHIFQETLSNIRKHARATHVIVTLEHDAKFHLSVRDNGVGFNPSECLPESHIGIRIMKERAKSINAELSIWSQLGQGAKISLDWEELPLV
jgi:two-component system nitrate/nitrite sensor histidine kinase NarX